MPLIKDTRVCTSMAVGTGSLPRLAQGQAQTMDSSFEHHFFMHLIAYGFSLKLLVRHHQGPC